MKKSLKVLFLSIFFVALSFVFINNVSAVEISETLDTTEESEDNGTYIIGITRFSPDVVITAQRVSDATFNDVIFNYGKPSYTGVKIYLLSFGEWYVLNENGTSTPLDEEEDEDLIEELSNPEIYYVDNIEKLIEMDFTHELGEDEEFVFITDIDFKNSLVKVENGKLIVPATIRGVAILVKDEDEDDEDARIVLYVEKIQENNNFVDYSSLVSVPKGEFAEEAGIGTVKYDIKTTMTNYNEFDVVVNGILKHYTDADMTGAMKADGMQGNPYIVTLKIDAPAGVTEEQLAKMTVETAANEYSAEDLGGADKILNGDNYLYMFQLVNEGDLLVDKYITIDWDGECDYINGTGGCHIEPITYNIVKGDTLELEPDYQGSVSAPVGAELDTTGAGEIGYTIKTTLDPDTDDVLINVNGFVNRYEKLGRNGYLADAGMGEYENIVTLKFTAPEGIDDFTKLKVTATRPDGTRKTYSGETILDGDDYFYLYQAVDYGKTTENPVITIDWDGNADEEAAIGLMRPINYIINTDGILLEQDNEALVSIPTGEEEVDAGAGLIRYEIETEANSNEDIDITVKGHINHYVKETMTGAMKADGMKTSNIVTLKFTAPAGVTEADLAKMTVVTARSEYEGGDKILNGDDYFYLFQVVAGDGFLDRTKFITIDWDGEGALKPVTYTITIDEEAIIEPNVESVVSVPTGDELTSSGVVRVGYTLTTTLKKATELAKNDEVDILVKGTAYHYTKAAMSGRMLANGMNTSNIVTLKFTAPEGADLSKVEVQTARSYENNDKKFIGAEALDGADFLYLYQVVAGEDLLESGEMWITIDWDGADGAMRPVKYNVVLDEALVIEPALATES